MICRFCGLEFDEKAIQEHHLNPRFMDNPKGVGMKIPCDVKCHNILHLKIAAIIWRYVPTDKKQDCLNEVINFTKRGMNNGNS